MEESLQTLLETHQEQPLPLQTVGCKRTCCCHTSQGSGTWWVPSALLFKIWLKTDSGSAAFTLQSSLYHLHKYPLNSTIQPKLHVFITFSIKSEQWKLILKEAALNLFYPQNQFPELEINLKERQLATDASSNIAVFHTWARNGCASEVRV